MLLFNKRGEPVLEITIWVDVWSRWHFAAKNIIISPAKKNIKARGKKNNTPLLYKPGRGKREERWTVLVGPGTTLANPTFQTSYCLLG
jgi:hypothetical protein